MPTELIAQHPSDKRNRSRLMVIDRNTGSIEHKVFDQITDHLNKDDLLVLNDTKVIPARLFGTKYGGTASIEVLLDRQIGNDTWEALIRPLKRLSIGSVIEFIKGFYAEVKDITADGKAILYFASIRGFDSDIKKEGNIPLPPYIKENNDPKRYQTIYAKNPGATAAPTAGLHFTGKLLGKIKARKAYITLHTGYGTFAPVREDDITRHKMHKESYQITSKAIKAVKATKGRIIAVGTTSARLLESAKAAGVGDTDIFIYPGFQFKVVDTLITNFHLPRSTLMMLVSAFAGIDLIKKAYSEAIEMRYRFFSFGDAMLIL